MPEILLALFLVGMAVSTYVAARITLSDAVDQSVEGATLRLERHQGWLRDRLQRAREEHWDTEMTARIVAELSLAQAELRALERSPNAGLPSLLPVRNEVADAGPAHSGPFRE